MSNRIILRPVAVAIVVVAITQRKIYSKYDTFIRYEMIKCARQYNSVKIPMKSKTFHGKEKKMEKNSFLFRIMCSNVNKVETPHFSRIFAFFGITKPIDYYS